MYVLFTNVLRMSQLMKVIKFGLLFCVDVLFLLSLNHKICLILFAICVYLNKKVSNTNYPHVNITNSIEIIKTMTVYIFNQLRVRSADY